MATLALLPLSEADRARLDPILAEQRVRAITADPTPVGLAAAGRAAAALVVDPMLFDRLTPQSVARLRRTPTHPLQRKPIVVLIDRPEEAAVWRRAGADPLLRTARAPAVAETIAAAVSTRRPFVESIAYVGPCRRHKPSRVRRSLARRDDAQRFKPLGLGGLFVARETTEQDPNEKPHSAVVDRGDLLMTQMRKIRVTIQGLSARTPEGRQEFLELLNRASRVAERSDPALVRALADIRLRLLNAGPTGPIDENAIERSLEDWAMGLWESEALT